MPFIVILFNLKGRRVDYLSVINIRKRKFIKIMLAVLFL